MTILGNDSAKPNHSHVSVKIITENGIKIQGDILFLRIFPLWPLPHWPLPPIPLPRWGRGSNLTRRYAAPSPNGRGLGFADAHPGLPGLHPGLRTSRLPGADGSAHWARRSPKMRHGLRLPILHGRRMRFFLRHAIFLHEIMNGLILRFS